MKLDFICNDGNSFVSYETSIFYYNQKMKSDINLVLCMFDNKVFAFGNP